MRTLFIHELRNNLFGGKVAVAFILMTIAFFVSLGMMAQEYDNRLANYNESLSMPGQDLFWDKVWFWQEDGSTDNSDTITLPMGVVRKPEPLLFFCRGLDKRMRQSVEFMATFPIIDTTIKPDQETNLMKLVFTAPDLLFIVKVVVSLLAILFSYNLMVEEKERGTLKLLLVHGASRGSIFAGKFLGGLTSLWVAFAGAFLVYLLALVSLTPVSLGGEVPIRLVFIFFASLLHIAVFFGIGSAVSVFVRSSASALIVALFCWLLLVFALPGLSSLLAQQFAPVDSDQRVARAKLEKAQQMEKDYTEAHPEDTNISNTAGYGRRHDAIREQINAELEKIDDEHQRRKELQASMTTALARVSPVGSLTYLYASFSGSGLEDVRLYQDDLIRMRNTMNDRLTEFMQDPEFGRRYVAGGWNLPPDLKEAGYELINMPVTMGFRQRTIGEALAASWIDFFVLAVFALAGAGLTFFRFIGYDAR